MPIIKPRPNRVESVQYNCRLQEPNRDALVLYARFIGESIHYVLNRLIETTLTKDRDFVVWRTEHPDEVATTTTRRAVRANDVAPTARRA